MDNIDKNNIDKVINYSEKITQGVYNIELLINYAAEQGIEIADLYIQAFTDFKELEKKKSWTPEKEAEFWLVYTKISKLLKPVNVENIKFVENQEKEKEKESFFRRFWFKKPTIAKRVVRSYISITFAFIIITLSLQIYSITGSYLVSKVNETNKALLVLEKEYANLLLMGEDGDRKILMEKEAALIKIEELNNEMEARIGRLQEWIEIFDFNKRTSEKIIDSQSGPPGMFDATDHIQSNIFIIVSAKDNYEILNNTLNAFILPILYGILGALIFTLRSLKTDIQTIKYKIVSNKIKYLLHIAIGALAGLIINLFFTTNNINDEGIVSLSFSPHALSFVAGYSVEIIFNAMDKIINLINNSLARQESREEKINKGN